MNRGPHSVRLTPPARRALSSGRIPEKVAAAIWEFLNGPLQQHPRRVGKRLHDRLSDYYSARRGEYRIIYRIDDEAIEVEVIRIDHRRDVYRRG
ncbi:MAG: type II toxin-antitoxin system RelE/ParE family toxin [Microbacteriaceae bacterium]|nr:type II toxin-antitoxin system RelE/ParE family toxin [Microbacteriaceae bacterium]